MGLAKLGFLYKTLVLEHAKQPHHYAIKLPQDGQQLTLHNPTCGDTINVSLQIKAGTIRHLCFNGEGCTISQAAASMMTDELNGRTVSEAQRLIQAFLDLCMGKTIPEPLQNELGDAAVMGTVAEFPARIKCATLSWHAVQEILARFD
ncbi:Fe-S cluster assembly sulfur transfer protein SufU [uncultured Limosilactobacillus sp.]|uniref:Fe-S cluster assembly sulfur transfer protein SufU n=1 Tax=uncultured Limosilactobacillus sp. TaxID=2837629 RepID=UPI0025D8D399|nr:SUF system NifU family Fe-S cluster assembly protein [uncultured Limosilactobacillus sp.]